MLGLKLNHVSKRGHCGLVNTLRPRQNGCHFADNIFKCIFLNENVIILAKISLKFVPKGPINNIHALVQIMAWRRPGDKPLSDPMMVRLPMHICVTRPQWVKLCMGVGSITQFHLSYNPSYNLGQFSPKHIPHSAVMKIRYSAQHFHLWNNTWCAFFSNISCKICSCYGVPCFVLVI